MNPDQPTSIFEIEVDELSRDYLRETAKWARLIGLISVALGVLLAAEGLIFIFTGSGIGNIAGLQSMAGVFGLFYLGIGILSIYPGWKLIRFSGSLPAALERGDQPLFTRSFSDLRLVFRFWGIALIALFAMMVLLFAGMTFFAMSI